MKVLITGASGFTGRALIQYLVPDNDIEVTGLIRETKSGIHRDTGIIWRTADILDPHSLGDIVASAQPEAIIHLAGLNHGTPADIFATNICGTQNILEAAVRANPECRILIVSSSAVYGYQGNSLITENNLLLPRTEYAVSKAGVEILTQMHHRARGAHAALVRPFNLAGPGQSGDFICGKIVRQVAEILMGRREALELLETQSRRDFIDVRDVVRAYRALIMHPAFCEECSGRIFNIGSGKSYAISGVIGILEKITGKTFAVQLPSEPPGISVPSQRADYSRINRITGWTPRISLDETLGDMLTAVMAEI